MAEDGSRIGYHGRTRQGWLQALGRESAATAGDGSEKRCFTGDGSKNCCHGRRRQEEDGRDRLKVLGREIAATAGYGSEKRC